MPSESKSQRRTMQAAKHNSEFRRKMRIPLRVAEHYVAADKKRPKGVLRRLPEHVRPQR